MNHALKRIIALFLVGVLLITGLPTDVISNAATTVALQVTYNSTTRTYDISYAAEVEPAYTELTYHEPDGTLSVPKKYEAGAGQKYDKDNERVTISVGQTVLEADHIYDLTIKAYSDDAGTSLAYTGSVYYLANMTFTGESFNIMGVNGFKVPLDNNGKIVYEPKIRFRWKIPTVYTSTDGIVKVTDSPALSLLQEASAPIKMAYFQISMTVGHGSTRILTYNTDYNNNSKMIIEHNGNEAEVSIGSDGYASVTLGKEHGIEAGTEYELTNIGLLFKDTNSQPLLTFQTKLRINNNNHFTVKNIDDVYNKTEYGLNGDLTSVFTPMEIEMTRVDSDKVEVRFKRIINGVYPELYYQVQHASRPDDFFNQTNKWVKIPDSSISGPEGSEIVTIPILDADNPEYYIRVVYYDSSAAFPKGSSLCLDLKDFGIETGKPSLPKEIKAEAIYKGKADVKVPRTDLSADLSDNTIKIPLSNLKLSFEVPQALKSYATSESAWENFKKSAKKDEDYIFHVILSTHLPESTVKKETKRIGLTTETSIYLPTQQKRTLVLDVRDFDLEDGRLVIEIDGSKLFYDYVGQRSLSFENNADVDGDNKTGDYPEFLVPNTTYYLQLFTSRRVDNEHVDGNWANSNNNTLKDRISYMSPIISFTTYPLDDPIVPIPNFLKIDSVIEKDAATQNITLSGISVEVERLLTNAEWGKYVAANTTGRAIEYRFYISREPDKFGNQAVITHTVKYSDDANPPVKESVTITHSGITLPNGRKEPILPNTVYYIKACAVLMVDDVALAESLETAVKAITTPKIDSGGLENVDTAPRAPVEFDIAQDENGQDLVSDAWVVLSWLHAEKDVTYDLVCTTVNLSPQAISADYATDPYNVGLITAYPEIAQDSKLVIDVNSTTLSAIGLTVNSQGGVTLPIDRDFLRPNRIYYFSLRAVRNRGMTDPSGKTMEISSRWITIPVTTRLVQAPEQFEAVKDLEIGFNVECTYSGVNSDSFEVYIKKSEDSDSQFTLLNRAQYTSVMDGTTLYVRIYNLASDQWYDVRIKNKLNDTWYDQNSKTWKAQVGSPVKAKTRNPLNEIEVRWEGQDPYTYYLEARSESESNYVKLNYSSTGFTDYGYDLLSGGRIQFYREKTNLQVQEGSAKYIYYAKISGKPVTDSSGNVQDRPLRSNTLYYVRLWAVNQEESLRVGPVTMRTDFSQADYDKDKLRDGVIDLFNEAADGLMEKLYWLVDIKEGTAVRVILKDDMVSGLLQAASGSTVTVDLSGETESTTYYEILIPYKTLLAIDTYDSRLNIKVVGAEVTFNRGSIDLEGIKSQVLTNGAKEAMLLVRIESSKSTKTALPSGLVNASPYYTLQATGIGSRRTYAEISNMIYDILKKPDAKGPFKYGILDRELTNILKDLDSYSYRTHNDLKDLIQGAIKKVEIELSRYLKDILDGGSGLAADYIITRSITSFPGGMGVKLEYTYKSGLTLPYVNYGATWNEASGGKGYVANYVLFRVGGPGQYAIVVKPAASVQPGSPFETTISLLSSRYDLTKVFGKGTIYPENPVKGEQAVMLYAVLNKRDNEITGMTPKQQVSTLGIGDVMGTKQLTGYMDNQSSVSLAVKLYCARANINAQMLKPVKTIYISNGSEIDSSLYRYVVLGVDLNLTKLDNQRFDAKGRTSIGALLDMMSKAIEKFE